MRWRTCKSCGYTEMMIQGKWSATRLDDSWEKGRQFFLGTLPEKEREGFDIQFMVDSKLADELEVVEQKLIEDFVEDELSDTDKVSFLKNYLVTEERRRRVAAEQTFQASMARIVRENADNH
ncbi:MAG: hypothetical protein M3Q64_02985 [bacterium]|nr:hypothetical protein [bacterium]